MSVCRFVCLFVCLGLFVTEHNDRSIATNWVLCRFQVDCPQQRAWRHRAAGDRIDGARRLAGNTATAPRARHVRVAWVQDHAGARGPARQYCGV
jgi:hypothetical protein